MRTLSLRVGFGIAARLFGSWQHSPLVLVGGLSLNWSLSLDLAHLVFKHGISVGSGLMQVGVRRCGRGWICVLRDTIRGLMLQWVIVLNLGDLLFCSPIIG